jgi:hypothetical protein
VDCRRTETGAGGAGTIARDGRVARHRGLRSGGGLPGPRGRAWTHGSHVAVASAALTRWGIAHPAVFWPKHAPLAFEAEEGRRHLAAAAAEGTILEPGMDGGTMMRYLEAAQIQSRDSPLPGARRASAHLAVQAPGPRRRPGAGQIAAEFGVRAWVAGEADKSRRSACRSP